MGIYKNSNSRVLVDADIQNIKDLAQNETNNLPEDFSKLGYFDTEELILLNNVDHRSNFIGPYTACLRHVLSNVPPISTTTGGSDTSLRQDLNLFNREA